MNAKLVVHRRTLGFVLLKGLDTELRLARVECANDTIRAGNLDEFQQHGHESEYRVGGRTVGCVHVGRNRMIRAMHERIAVDDGDRLGCGGVGRRDLGNLRRSVFFGHDVASFHTKATTTHAPLRHWFLQ